MLIYCIVACGARPCYRGSMGLWDRYAVPRLIGFACAQKPVMERRRHVVPRAEGLVLELGAGGGINFPLYDPRRVTRVEGVDPSPGLLTQARDAAKAAAIDFDIRDAKRPTFGLPHSKPSLAARP